jgi:hypothetical protein
MMRPSAPAELVSMKAGKTHAADRAAPSITNLRRSRASAAHATTASTAIDTKDPVIRAWSAASGLPPNTDVA